jgi:hypothetical protein
VPGHVGPSSWLGTTDQSRSVPAASTATSSSPSDDLVCSLKGKEASKVQATIVRRKERRARWRLLDTR